MKASTWFLALAALLLFAGCAAAVAEQAEVAQPKTAAAQPDAVAAEDVDGEAKPIPPGFEPPFPGSQNFFTPPQVDIANVSGLAKNADGTPEVRVLGFVKVESGADRAIVQVGPLTDVIEPGTVLQGIEVVSLQRPTITLQFNGARWNVSMFDQPITRELATNQRGRLHRGPAAMKLPKAGLHPPSLPQLPAPPSIPLPPLPK